jgi:hypothetical protein
MTGLRRHKAASYRPLVEMLEIRNLLSTFTVGHLADDLVGSGLNGSLRYCVTNAVDNDTITFGVTGTINLTGALPDLTHSISIQGPGASNLTVRRNTGGDYRIFTVDIGTTVSIAGLTITGGHVAAGAGSGILNSGTLTVSNTTVSGNYSDGISNSGMLTVSNSIVSGNGGGIFNSAMLTVTNTIVFGNGTGIDNRGMMSLSNSTVEDNVNDGSDIGFGYGFDVFGAGIVNSGTLTISNSTISGNLATTDPGYISWGGGILNDGGTLTISNSTISDNRAIGGLTSGGGIENGGTLTISSSTISNNSAVGNIAFGPADGGGIHNRSGATLTITNSTLFGNAVSNEADRGSAFGGGIYSEGALTVTNSTISGNQALGSFPFSWGGGIAGIGVNVRNTIIAGNMAPDGPDLGDNVASQGHNLIGNSSGLSGFDPTDLLNVNPQLGPLQDNGGPTQTMALLAGSPALNAGDPAQLGVADQRGVVRTGGVNIGAYQASASVLVFTVSAPVTAGDPFTITVTVQDPYGNTAVGYTGTVHFMLTGQSMAQADYTFTATDMGSRTFSGLVLSQAGDYTLAGMDSGDQTISGNISFTVSG